MEEREREVDEAEPAVARRGGGGGLAERRMWPRREAKAGAEVV